MRDVLISHQCVRVEVRLVKGKIHFILGRALYLYTCRALYLYTLGRALYLYTCIFTIKPSLSVRHFGMLVKSAV